MVWSDGCWYVHMLKCVKLCESPGLFVLSCLITNKLCLIRNFWICCCSWCFVHQSLRKFHLSAICPLQRCCFKVVFSEAIISLQTEQKHRVYYSSSNPSTSNSHGLPREKGSLVTLVTPFPRIIRKKYSFPLAKLYII